VILPLKRKAMIQQTGFTIIFLLMTFLLVMVSAVQAQPRADSEKYLKASRYDSAELLSSIEQTIFSEISTVEDIKKRLARLRTGGCPDLVCAQQHGNRSFFYILKVAIQWTP